MALRLLLAFSAEIAACKLAVSKARTRALRQHGQRMVREHTMLQAAIPRVRQHLEPAGRLAG